jgi:hypothetical protein
MRVPIIFLRVAWMHQYKGITKHDVPNGAGSYVTKNRDGGEVLNFKSIGGNYYGFARIKNGHRLNINRLGAKTSDDFIDRVTVVFFATDPSLGGQYIVGWYENARLYRKVQNDLFQRNPHPYYMAVSAIRNSTLLPLKYRKFEVPVDGPGQTNAWYVCDYADSKSFLKKFFRFKENPEIYCQRKITSKGKKGWMLEAEKRKKIEIAAMDATYEYFEVRGFKVQYVHNEKLGWDMEALKGKVDFKLEVKGSCNPLEAVLLTPNEFFHSKNYKNYRVCVLDNALDSLKAKFHIFQLDKAKEHWISDTGFYLKVKQIVSAKLELDNV